MATKHEDLQQKLVTLDLTGIPEASIDGVKTDIGELLTIEIGRSVAKGSSPVRGHGSFDILTKKYAKEEKQGRRVPNLNLEGDLLQSLGWSDEGGNRISVGIQDKNERDKANGHNWIDGRKGPPGVPRRRFIPAADERFKRTIESKVNQILDNARRPPPIELPFEITERNHDDTTSITLNSLTGSVIERLLRGR